MDATGVMARYHPQDQDVQVRALTERQRDDLRDPGRLDLRGAMIGDRLDRRRLRAHLPYQGTDPSIVTSHAAA